MPPAPTSRRVLAVIAAAAVILMPTACIPPEEDNDRLVAYKKDTAMGAVQTDGVLRVGIEGRAPLSAGSAGFAVDVAEDIAASLGVTTEYTVGSAEDLLVALNQPPEDERNTLHIALDIAFPALPITEERVRRNAFSDPYYVGHQRMVVGSGSDLGTVWDLGPDDQVCVVDDPAASADVEEIDRLTEVGGPKASERCRVELTTGKADAVTASDLALIEMVGNLASFEFLGDHLTTEGYGAAVRKDLPGLADYVNVTLAEAKLEGRWDEWYARWIEPHLGPITERPTMTAEEAAALFPSDF